MSKNRKEKIKLFADHNSWPLWGLDTDNLGDIPLDRIKGLSDELRNRLENWADEYDKAFEEDLEIPSNAPPASPERIEKTKAWNRKFKKEGALMWLELRKEIGEDYEVLYQLSGEPYLTDPKQLENYDFWTS